MAEFTPAVHRDLIRNSLPGPNGRKVANVADDEIDGYIRAATRKVLRDAGEPLNAGDKAEAEDIISLYARADTLERALIEQGASEVPLATALRERADAQLTSFDLGTSGGDETGKASKYAGWANLTPDQIGLWSPADFYVSDPTHTAGSSGRDIWP